MEPSCYSQSSYLPNPTIAYNTPENSPVKALSHLFEQCKLNATLEGLKTNEIDHCDSEVAATQGVKRNFSEVESDEFEEELEREEALPPQKILKSSSGPARIFSNVKRSLQFED